jgi:hypothetical protein
MPTGPERPVGAGPTCAALAGVAAQGEGARDRQFARYAGLGAWLSWMPITAPCFDGDAGYLDPTSGLFVQTARTLCSWGACCEQGCRHCPFGER